MSKKIHIFAEQISSINNYNSSEMDNKIPPAKEQQKETLSTNVVSQYSDENKTKNSTRSRIHQRKKDDKVHVEFHELEAIAKAISHKTNGETIPSIFASIAGSGILTSAIEFHELYKVEDSKLDSAILWIVIFTFCLFIMGLSIIIIIKRKNEEKQTLDSLRSIVNTIIINTEGHNFPLNSDGNIDYEELYRRHHNICVKNEYKCWHYLIYRYSIFLFITILPFQAFSKTTNYSITTTNQFSILVSILGGVVSIIALITTILSTRTYYLSKKQIHKYEEELNKLKNQNSNPEKRNKQLIQEGTTALTEGNIHTAIKKYTEAIILDPNQPQIFEKRADAYNLIGNSNQSLEDYKRALHFYPDNTSNHIQILHKIANLHYNTGSIIESDIYYNKALDAIEKLNPKKKVTLSNEIVQIINDYASLLIDQNNYTKADSLLSKAHELLQSDISEKPDLLAMTLNNSAIVYKETNQYPSAEKYYTEALSIYRKLLEKDPDTHLPDVAMMLNNLANLHSNTNQYKEAEEEYNEALNTYQQLADKNPDAYLPNVAMTLNNLANLHSITNQLDKAGEEFNKALTTYRQLADQNPNAYLPDVAMTLNNLAIFHKDTIQYEKAEEEFNEALTTYRQLAAQNFDAYLPDVAMTLNNLAVLHSNTNQYKEAEEEYNEALKTYHQLADKNPDAYLPDVAGTLNNLGLLHEGTNQLDKAEKEFNEALTIRRQLAEKNPDAYLPDVAMTLNNLAILHKNTSQYKEAEEEYNEALTIRRQLADKTPDAYLPNVADTLENLANLHSNTDRLQDAEEEYKAVLSIRQKLADKYPDAYLHKVAQTLYNMALLHRVRKEYPAAEAAALESLEKYRIMAEMSHAAFDKDVKDAEELLERIQKAKKADA